MRDVKRSLPLLPLLRFLPLLPHVLATKLRRIHAEAEMTATQTLFNSLLALPWSYSPLAADPLVLVGLFLLRIREVKATKEQDRHQFRMRFAGQRNRKHR